MSYDKLRYADPKTYLMHDFGDIDQSHKATMSFSLDKTPDSFGKLFITNSTRMPMEPGTICYSVSTDTWWICKEDSVEEIYQGTKYKHILVLEGAFEFFKRFDIASCGFNTGRYTYLSFFQRLLSKQISGMSMQGVINLFPCFSSSTTIQNMFTFSNYNLKSSIQEICDSCDCIPRLTFYYVNDLTPITYVLKFIPKTGIPKSLNPSINLDNLDIYYEKLKLSSDSFANKVTSNVDNAVSSKLVRFPKSGAVYPSYGEYKLSTTESYFQLPESCYECKELEVFIPLVLGYFNPNDGTITDRQVIYLTNRDSAMAMMKKAILASVTSIVSDDSVIDDFAKTSYDYHHISIDKNGVETNANNYLLISNSSASNIIKLTSSKNKSAEQYEDRMVIWEPLSKKISNLHFQLDYKNGEVQANWVKKTISVEFVPGTFKDVSFYVRSLKEGETSPIKSKNIDWMRFAVKYYPISDIRISNYNYASVKNIDSISKYYNQNGKMNDPFKSGKLVESYSKDQEGVEMTRQKKYSSFSSIPMIGQTYYDHGDSDKVYVLDKMSIELDSESHFSVLHGLSSEKIKKSSIISANQSTLDFKTPQENNVLRDLIMGDVMWLSFNYQEGYDLFCLQDMLSRLPTSSNSFVFDSQCVIESEYNSFSHFFVANGIEIPVNKGFCYQVKLPDNNIIGYSKTSTGKIINWTNWINGGDKIRYNIPISYTDENGECSSINFMVMDSKTLSEITSSIYYQCVAYDSLGNETHETYASILGGDVSLQDPLFPTPYGFPNASTYMKSLSILKNGNSVPYIVGKDGLEIPRMIYTLQTIDKNGIFFGTKFFDQSFSEDSYAVYWLCYESNAEIRDSNRTYGDSENALINTGIIIKNISWNVETSASGRTHGCYSRVVGNQYLIQKGSMTYNGKSFSSITKTNFEEGKNYELYEVSMFIDEQTGEVISSKIRFAFSINNCPINGDTLSIYINNVPKILV